MDDLSLCEEAIRAAERYPKRHDEYKGSILSMLDYLRVKILSGRFNQQDERTLTEIIMLTEKWTED